MDQIREFFYWTASIAAILFGIFTIALLALLIYIKRLASRGFERLDESLEHVSNATRTWKNFALARFIIRTIRFLI